MPSSKIEAMRPHRRVEIQVTSPPAPLAVHDMSRKIQKPPRASASAAKGPVIIYMVSPKVIHVDASEFMSLVQRLTGPAGEAGASGKVKSSGGRGRTTSTSDGGGGGGGGVHRPLPVKVKASRAAPKGSGPDEQQYPVISSDMSPTLYFHDLSPPSFGVRKDSTVASSPTSWLLHGDYLDQSPRYQSDSALVSSSSFLDMLSQLPER